MSLNINLTPDDIESLVKDSIMRSGFGLAVTSAIEKAMKLGYNSPVEQELQCYISTVVRNLLQSEYGAQIREAVLVQLREKMTQEFIDEIATRVATSIRFSNLT